MDAALEDDTINEEVSVEDKLYPEEEKSEEGSSESEKDTDESKESEDEKSEDVEKDSEESSKDEADKESKDEKEIVYELELGKETLLEKSAVEDVESFAKENNLSKDTAQEILSKQEKAVSQWWEKAQSKHENQVDQWRKDVEADPVLGGENLERVTKQARSVVDKFASQEFVTMLKDTGYGNHPELVRFLSTIGKELSNDSLVLPRAKEATRNIEDIFYGNNN